MFAACNDDDDDGDPNVTEDFIILTVREDNTFAITSQAATVEGSWHKFDDIKYIFLIGTESTMAEFKDNLCVMEDGEERIVFKFFSVEY